MRRFIPLVLAIAIFIQVKAQETSRADLQSLVNAERSFIQMAKEKNTRDAFIAFLADDAVTFGNEPRIGKEYLQKQTPNEGWLFWQPVYSDISSRGDFGFNTGPWEYRNNRKDEKAVAFGQFVTVWRKIRGEWKAVIDMGISHGQPVHHETWKTSSIKLEAKPGIKTPTSGILDAEKEFVKRIEEKGNGAYLDVLSPDVRVYRGGSEPMISSGETQNFFERNLSKVSFTQLDGQISAANDMAFVYGKCSVEEMLDNKPATRHSHYMRIWKKERDTWMIVLDLIQ